MFSRSYRNRSEAGKLLARRLACYADQHDVLILGLPRGGVPVAYEVATALHVPLDIFVVRKLGVPGYEELAMGAIATGGVQVLNEDVVRGWNVDHETIEAVAAEQYRELTRREYVYRGTHDLPYVSGKSVILIDDGIATGSTMRAAVQALRQQLPLQIIIAVPVAPLDASYVVGSEADEYIALMTPQNFNAVGQWYDDFTQTTDAEVTRLMAEARAHTHSHGAHYP